MIFSCAQYGSVETSISPDTEQLKLNCCLRDLKFKREDINVSLQHESVE